MQEVDERNDMQYFLSLSHTSESVYTGVKLWIPYGQSLFEFVPQQKNGL